MKQEDIFVVVINYYINSRHGANLDVLVAIGEQELNDALVKILKKKYECNHFLREKYNVQAFDFTEEDFDKLPESIRKKSEIELKAYRRQIGINQELERINIEAQEAIKSNNGWLAYDIIKMMEYEYNQGSVDIFFKRKEDSLETSYVDIRKLLLDFVNKNKQKEIDS